ncbi:hypothetical protein [Catellatospora tritici]|uniref:hypothetical protein n=1 Tax=Catellatospora tritici TaxID=2851566 RepID=UPI001C2D6F27|nr:hypothetical protein [Catellatospora tritici]MBV1850113.1 hypothetical protein [Catellatospora tritici]
MFDYYEVQDEHLDPERLAATAARAEAGDAAAAYRIGRHFLGQNDWDLRDRAEPWFVRAAQLGGPEAAWWIVQAYAGALDGRARQWLRRAVGTESDPGGIEVDYGTLPIELDHGHAVDQDWRIRVRSDDRPRTVAALHAARPRLMQVGEDGREYGDAEWPPRHPGGGDLYTPNTCQVDDRGEVPEIWLDCKSVIYPLMARTVIRIVAQELRAAGLSRALLFTEKIA